MVIIRLATAVGRSRFEMPADSTFAELKERVEKSSGIPPGKQKLAFDPQGDKLVASVGTVKLKILMQKLK
jgi:hypothetical protein